MRVYDSYLDDCIGQLEAAKGTVPFSVLDRIPDSAWPQLKTGCLVMEKDTAVELGHPKTESLSMLLMTSSPGKFEDGITLIGKDICELKNGPVSYGKIVLIELDESVDGQEAYDKYREVEQIRHSINLDGYMLRAAFQKSKEWSRISHEAVDKGFSFQIYGSELMNAYKRIENVRKAHVIFITEYNDLIRSFTPLADKTVVVTQALNKIFDDLEFNCGSCSFQEVCEEIEGLKEMHGKGMGSKK